jgi:Protein of Unknown function (DUF2784)
MDELLNAAFFVFHTSWIVFTCLGWIWRATRPWQLTAAVLTALSWFCVGMRYGWGYCPCTDWHWQVRARLGYQDPPSYTQVLISELTGVSLSSVVADTLTVGTLAVVTVLGVVLNLRDRRRATTRMRS